MNIRTAFCFALMSLAFCSARAQTLNLIKADSAIRLCHLTPKDSNQVIIINFWATWCGPCVEEIPLFKQVNEKMNDSNYHFYFVSMDSEDVRKKVEKFIKKMAMPGSQAILERTNLNNFINKVDERWEGAIPFTIVITYKDRRIHEGAFDSYLQLWHFIRE